MHVLERSSLVVAAALILRMIKPYTPCEFTELSQRANAETQIPQCTK